MVKTVMNDLFTEKRELKNRYAQDTSFKRRIDSAKDGEFERAWTPCENNFPLLLDFASGLASIMAGSHTVESDFSKLRRIKGKTRSQLSNYALEGQLHAEQYQDLLRNNL